MKHSKPIVIAFGRFNPPTRGHDSLITFILSVATRSGGDVRIYPSTSHDPKSNPLSFPDKVRFLKQLYPKVDVSDNRKIKSPFDAFAEVAAAGYRHIIVAVGSDRADEFNRFSTYMKPKGSRGYDAAKHINIDKYEVVVVPTPRNDKSTGVAGLSASKLRGFAAAGQKDKFISGVPTNNTRLAGDIYTKTRAGMGITEATMAKSADLTNQMRARVLPEAFGYSSAVRRPVDVKPMGQADYPDCASCKTNANVEVGYKSGNQRSLHCLKCGKRWMGPITEAKENLTPAQKTVRKKLADLQSQLGSHKKAEEVLACDSWATLKSYAEKAMKNTPAIYRVGVRDRLERMGLISPVVKEAAAMTTPKPPTEVDRMKTRQSQETISLKQRQNNEIMAAKMREIQQKSREQQMKTVTKESYRKNDGHKGSKTPKLDDDVKIMGQVHNAGKTGYVAYISMGGTHMEVRTYGGESLGFYHVSDLQVRHQ